MIVGKIDSEIIFNDRIPFCDKKLKKGEGICPCHSFVRGLPNGLHKCPFGMTVAKCGTKFLCAFGTVGSCDENAIKGKNRVSHNYQIKLLTKEQGEKLYEILEEQVYIDIASEAAHEITHFVGDLKTNIDLCERYDHRRYKVINDIVSRYRRYINASDVFQKTQRKRIAPDWFEHPRHYDEYLQLLKEQRKRYDTFLGEIDVAANELEPRVADAYDKYYDDFLKNGYLDLTSLLAIQSLFSFRIRYYKESRDRTLKPQTRINKKTRYHCLHKMCKKLACVLHSKAGNKGLYFVFEGVSKEKIRASEDLYLAIYILLENAIKYAFDNTKITIVLEDLGEHCASLKIINYSDPVSDEELKHIEELGYSGKNASNKNSHGIGLSLVKRIGEDNDFSRKYDYDKKEGTFIAKLFRPVSQVL